MRIFLTSLIFLLSFSLVFAQNRSDIEVNQSSNKPDMATLSFMGYGYIPVDSSKDLIGFGGGGSVKATVNINRYFAVGLSAGVTAASSNYQNAYNLTLLTNARLLLIAQRETLKNQPGVVPWGGLGIGVVAGSGSYGAGHAEDMLGYDVAVMAGIRYNFSKVFLGLGAEFSISNLSGYLVNGSISKSPYSLYASSVNVFGEVGFRF